MTLFQMAIKGMRFHFRNHLGVFLGVALSTAVIVGALLVGDSLRYSLKRLGEQRLVNVKSAIMSQDRFFREALAEDMEAGPYAPALFLPASASNSDNERRANKVQVLGVEDRFWPMGNTDAPFDAELGERQIVINDILAERLGAEAGDSIVLRVANPSLMPRDAPFSSEEDVTLAVRAEIAAVIGPEQFGRFSLQASQRPAATAFVPLSYLQKRLELDGKANLLLSSKAQVAMDEESSSGELVHSARQRIEKAWKLEDAALKLIDIPGQDAYELRTDRVFIDDVAAAASKNTGLESLRVLTYFGNSFHAGTNATPFSMVAGLSGDHFLPDNLGRDEAVINDWVAEDLGISVGDEFRVKYFVIGDKRTLEERSASFKVVKVVPITGLAGDRELMPNLPGITDSEDCSDWEPGMPLDLNKIRDKDEVYWDDHRGTPKAFIRLDVAQELWTNRFGALTAIRYAKNGKTQEELEEAILSEMSPLDYGLHFVQVGEQAEKAGTEGLDLGQYFAYFSFFIIVAALALGGLLFLFGIEQRREEIAALFAMGYPAKLIRKLLFREGAVVVLMGGLLGVVGGGAYTRFLLWGLTGAWNGAVGITALAFHAEPMTVVAGVLIGIFVGLSVLWWVLWRYSKRGISELFAGTVKASGPAEKAIRKYTVLTLVFVLAGVGLIFSGGAQNAGAFFGGGALVLVGGLCLASARLRVLGRAKAHRGLDLRGLGVRQAARNHGRSLVAVGTLASGVFLVVGIGAFRQGELSLKETARVESGTGGFGLLLESAQAIYTDLNDPQVREDMLLEEPAFDHLNIVQMRLREGEEASCLNLNKAQRPQLLGVDPKAMAGRFSFVKVLNKSLKDPWALLDGGPDEEGAYPAIADNNSIMYAMMSGVGKTVDVVDEKGNLVKLRLVAGAKNSILQGSILIGEETFKTLYPSASGYRVALIEGPGSELLSAMEGLRLALREVGPELTDTRKRLLEFNQVQNAYIAVFQALGGIGVLLGTIGLAVIVLRNVLERRRELIVLEAMGYRRRTLRKLIFSEHFALLQGATLIGCVAAFAAVLPHALCTGENPWLWIFYAVVGLTLSGMLWIWVATRAALRGCPVRSFGSD